MMMNSKLLIKIKTCLLKSINSNNFKLNKKRLRIFYFSKDEPVLIRILVFQDQKF